MLEPVVKEVVVPVDRAVAFRRFTEEIGVWWPRASHSVSQERCAAVRMEGRAGGRLYEVSEDGAEHDWGRVEAWDPPASVVLLWHAGRSAAMAQRVKVEFAAEPGGTRVRLEHGDWEVLGGEAERMRANYDGGWEPVLERYVASLAGETAVRGA